MKIFTRIIGNLNTPEWRSRAEGVEVESIELDQWTAQKSRLVVRSDRDNEYAVSLERNSRMTDGDVVEYLPQEGRMVVVRIRLNEVLVADLEELEGKEPQTVIRVAVELGHAIGNQHWPAVVKGSKVYVPLTVDKKVMESVMHTHHIEGVRYSFQPGGEVIPYLAPHEVRRLFGGTGPDSDVHHHHHAQPEHEHPHRHADGVEHSHPHCHSHGEEHLHEHGHEHEHEHGCGRPGAVESVGRHA
ncbi:MAG: urease accessory protein UreE [Rikenellaceae bacterium]|nr:urease accessory protein UreE [Rikenellaceae bacterium]